MKRLSSLVYPELSNRYDDIPSYYRVCAISKAAEILSTRRKSMTRGFNSKEPRLHRHLLTSSFGFKIEKGSLLVPIGGRQFERVHLNAHTLDVLSQPGVTVRPFSITEKAVSLSIAKERRDIKLEEITGAVGIDRNLLNIAAGNDERVTFYDMTKVVKIAENTRGVMRSIKRDDARLRRKLFSKYGGRQSERTRQILHRVSKQIVQDALTFKKVMVFEDIRGIRKLYRKSNGQGASYRGMMNSWPFSELKRQVEYKAEWEGIPVITLTTGETSGPRWTALNAGRDSKSRFAAMSSTAVICGATTARGGSTATSLR